MSHRSLHAEVTVDPEFKALPAESRGIWLQLVFHPANGMSGLFYFPISQLEDFTGYPQKKAWTIFERLTETRWVVYDFRTSLLWIRNQLRFDPGKPLLDRKKRAAIAKHLYTLPRSPLLLEFIRSYHLESEYGMGELLDSVEKLVATSKGLVSPSEGASVVGSSSELVDKSIRAEKGSAVVVQRVGPHNRMSVKRRDGLADEAFRRFWELYPRKRNMIAAEKAWKKLKPDQGLVEQILRDVEARRDSPEWKKFNPAKGERPGQFIPYPASYLNGQRWKDGPDEDGGGGVRERAGRSIAAWIHSYRLEAQAYVFGVSIMFLVISGTQTLAVSGIGLMDQERLLQGLIAVVPTLVFVQLGIWTTPYISKKWFNRIVLTMIVVMEAKLIWQVLGN